MVLFFASSFSLALLANQRSGAVDDLGLAIPAAVQTETAVTEDELPQMDNDVPVATDSSQEGDMPSLD